MTQGPVVPPYGSGTLGAVLPGAARALGIPTGLDAVDLPASHAVCVVLLDGLGAELLAEAAVHAPFLARMSATGRTLRAGCPTTTATSLGSFGTGLPPGRHGLVGYRVLDPDRDELLNELGWHPDTDPRAWQPHPTVFETAQAAGVSVTRIGNPEFAGSGLTEAAQRGGAFLGLKSLRHRVSAAADALLQGERALVYLYWGEIDAVGHAVGWRSHRWRHALHHADRLLAGLASRLPTGGTLVVTADHGMVDIPRARRFDLAMAPALRDGIRIVGGEPRFAQLYCEPGVAADVAGRVAAELGESAWVRTREQAVAEGWFGPVEDRVRRRIGDVLVASRGTSVFIDSSTMNHHELALVGHHGSLTEAEQLVPLLVHQA